MPFIVENGAFGAGFCNALIKSRADSVAAPADKTLGIFTFCGKSTMSAMRSDLVSIKNKL